MNKTEIAKTGKLPFIPRTKKLIRTLKVYWQQFKEAEQVYRHSIAKIEQEMQKELREDLVSFQYDKDGSCVGISTPADPKILKLVDKSQLEG